MLGARYLFLSLALAEAWIAAQALEMAAVDLPTKLMWANIQYIPIMLTPLAYLYLTLQFTRHENWLRRHWLPLLFLIPPVAINILLWSGDFQWLIRQNVYLNTSGPFSTIGKTYGPLFWLFAVYNYAITILTMINLANAFREKISFYRKQILFLFIAVLMPVIANLIQISGLNPFIVDITPSFLGLSALAMSWGILRYRLFDVIPIARSIIIQEMRAGMIVFDNEGRFLDINPAARKMLSLPSEQPIGHSIEEELGGMPELIRIFKEGKNAICELAFENSGTHCCYEISFAQIKISEKEYIGWLLQIYDITERKIAEEIIQHAAFHDALTGLPNRDYFQVLFSQELAHSRMCGDLLTTVFLDLDNFKAINDTYGHHAGDIALCRVAERLNEVLCESDIISRIGGDEFAIILPHIGNNEEIEIIAKKMLKIFETGFDCSDTSFQMHASIGFSVFPRDGDNIEILLKKADKAMYTIKSSIKNSFCIYHE